MDPESSYWLPCLTLRIESRNQKKGLLFFFAVGEVSLCFIYSEDGQLEVSQIHLDLNI